MTSKMIRVRALEGRKAFTAPSGGSVITTDEAGQLVRETDWIIRLLDVHKDLVRVKEKPKTRAEKPATTDEPAN